MKKMAVLSDVHIVHPDDRSYSLLIKFLDHVVDIKVDVVVLLGDIFNLMVGEYKAYTKIYFLFFERLQRLISLGVEVHFFEGNHDFHTRDLFKGSGVVWHARGEYLSFDGVRYYFTHGDEAKKEDRLYSLYKYLVGSFLVRFLLRYVVPYRVLCAIGAWANARSRGQRYKRRLGDEWKHHFRVIVSNFVKRELSLSVDVVVMGHFHVQDAFFISQEEGRGFLYVNGGAAFEERSFLLLEGRQFSFRTLDHK